MEEDQAIRRIEFDPTTWDWALPAELSKKLDGLATLAGICREDRGTPLPEMHRLQILEQLLDHLLPDGTTGHLLLTTRTVDSRQKGYLANLIWCAGFELERRHAEAPSTLLGSPPNTRSIWANLLEAGWWPWQQDSPGLDQD